MRRRWGVVVAAAASFLVLSGCKIDVRVALEADNDGGGEVAATVTVDRDVQGYFADLRKELRVGDLVDAGWKVEGPTELRNGDLQVRATKPYSSPQQVAAIVAELDQGQRIFHGFRLSQDRSLFKTTTSFRGRVDLRRGVESFSDEVLERELGRAFAGTDEQLSKRIGTTLAKAIPITIGVRLPGDAESNAPRTSGGSAAWHPKLGEDVTLAASSTRWNYAGMLLSAVALITGVLGALSAARYARRRARAARPG